jgi:hypothetical protein
MNHEFPRYVITSFIGPNIFEQFNQNEHVIKKVL